MRLDTTGATDLAVVADDVAEAVRTHPGIDAVDIAVLADDKLERGRSDGLVAERNRKILGLDAAVNLDDAPDGRAIDIDAYRLGQDRGLGCQVVGRVGAAGMEHHAAAGDVYFRHLIVP